MQILFKIFSQSLRLSYEEIVSSKLRSFLSLLGISIGILCVISVRTAVNSLEKNIKDGFDSFGTDILYVQKWPLIWTDENNYPWWRYFNRPVVNYKELKQLQENVHSADAMALVNFAGGKTVKYEDRIAENVNMTGATYDYNKIKDMEFVQGRYFTASEADHPTYVCILGSNIAASLFEGRTQIEGEDIRLQGVKLKVIGVFKKEGENILGWTLDNMILIPYSILSNFTNVSNGGGGDPLISVKPKLGVQMDELRYELKGAMRSIRRISPKQDDNFAINQMSVITDGISGIFSIVGIAGWIIGIFSILVGGFGIANIMFVSVKERTNIIGIKKALGAKQAYILMEFLLEAVMLCLLGGLMGLSLVLLLTSIANYVLLHFLESSFTFYLTASNVLLGVSISVIIGIIAGFIPAYQASKMRPVDAIRGN
jgi:putative ABC transport system permease protein